jgi:hypothetical protein
MNHTNKKTVYNQLTGKKPVIFARWVSPNIWLGYLTPHHKLPDGVLQDLFLCSCDL